MNKLFGLMAMAVLLCPACSIQSNGAVRSENYDTASLEKQRYLDKIQAKLTDLDQRIEAMKVTLRQEKRLDSKQMGQKMTDLDRRREAAHQQFAKLRISGPNAWEQTKAQVDKAMKDLDIAYEQAVQYFK
jgi:TolA-binding protein